MASMLGGRRLAARAASTAGWSPSAQPIVRSKAVAAGRMANVSAPGATGSRASGERAASLWPHRTRCRRASGGKGEPTGTGRSRGPGWLAVRAGRRSGSRSSAWFCGGSITPSARRSRRSRRHRCRRLLLKRCRRSAVGPKAVGLGAVDHEQVGIEGGVLATVAAVPLTRAWIALTWVMIWSDSSTVPKVVVPTKAPVRWSRPSGSVL